MTLGTDVSFKAQLFNKLFIIRLVLVFKCLEGFKHVFFNLKIYFKISMTIYGFLDFSGESSTFFHRLTSSKIFSHVHRIFRTSTEGGLSGSAALSSIIFWKLISVFIAPSNVVIRFTHFRSDSGSISIT